MERDDQMFLTVHNLLIIVGWLGFGFYSDLLAAFRQAKLLVRLRPKILQIRQMLRLQYSEFATLFMIYYMLPALLR